jgi:hypothetical protein
MRHIAFLLLFTFATALNSGCTSTRTSGTQAASAERHKQPIPSDLTDSVRLSEEIGGQLYVLDKVSAVATDALLAQVSNLKELHIKGYLPLQEAGEDGRAIVPIGADKVSELMPLSKGTMELPTKGPNGEKPTMLVMTHLTDYPLEIHVLASLQAKLPLMVAKRRGTWRVQGTHIEYWGESSREQRE